MIQKIVQTCLKNAVERFEVANAEVMKTWKGYCGCLTPGLDIKCLHCPYLSEYIQFLQKQIDSTPEKVFAQKLPPEVSAPYSDKVRHQCVDMYRNGYSIEKIKELTGVNNFRHIRRWLNEEGLLRTKGEYSKEDKERCIQLYIQGKTPTEIEEIMGISGGEIMNLVFKSGVSRPKNHYSESQRKLALSMYEEGESFAKIEDATGISHAMVTKYACQAKVYRKKHARSGRHSPYSDEFKQKCLNLLKEGKSPPQVEEIMGVSADTVRQWRKIAQKNDESDI